jgi:class 3 adenylate cyclase/tetratricopeptide (TPR) repeat protein
MSCQRCGFESPAGFRFCGSCGAALLRSEALGSAEERKIVSALMCDLAGSTHQAEIMDPEDVHRLLTPYYAAARGELEGFGGTVEKFIGDAVFALFGAPKAHGDDPERAVRAALALRDAVGDLNEADPGPDLHIRIGVTTGEVMVELGARPSEGQGMAWGDVLNTASRLQTAAPVDGILVDEATYRATRHAIEYGVAEPVSAKGKAVPVLVWEALAPLARRGLDLVDVKDEPFVGRESELSRLVEALDRVRERRTPELVTLVGEPGMGKSRLVFELFRRIELIPDLITWRHGRSSPYGDGFTFWALGEIVKAQAGILETDGAAAVSDKLDRTVADLVPDPVEAARIKGHLGGLVGLGSAAETHGDSRDAAFAAWRHFVEALGRQRPLVLVFGDIHWADDGLLDFVEHVLDWARDIPLLIVCTSRPELLERRSSWGKRKNATTLLVSPLSRDETVQLVSQLADGAIQTSRAEAIVGAASGNPLYAVEFVRMLEDRGLLRVSGSQTVIAADQALPVPPSLNSIIAARLDSLSADDKALLQDAAVVGRVVWPGVLAAIGGRSRRWVERRLRALERKEFLGRARRSSVGREAEYTFRHVLVRDVAYTQIPRLRRKEAHTRTADWLESLSPDRAADRAEMLAHHHLSAYELALALGAGTGELAESARVSLRDAGDRALSLHSFPAAARYFRAALGLWPEQDPERPWLLFRLGKALYCAETAGAEVLLEARDGLLDAGDPETAAEAESFLAALAHQRGQEQERVFEHANRAMALVESLGASRSKVEVLVDLALLHGITGDHEQAIGLAEAALRDAERLGLRELQARALSTIGISRGLTGDADGRIDLQRSIAITEEIGSYFSAHACGMLADLECSVGNLGTCFALQKQARQHAEHFGHASFVQWMKAEQVAEDYWNGRWREAVALADEFLAETESTGHFMQAYCRDMRGRIRLAAGDVEGALDDGLVALRQARALNEPQMLYPALGFRARSLAASDALDEASSVADELLALWRPKLNSYPASSWLVDLVCALDLIGENGELLETAGSIVGRTLWLEAGTAFARADFLSAAELFSRIGSRPDEALARLRSAQSLMESGHGTAARVELERAVAFYSAVDAAAQLSEAERLIAV